MNSTSNDAGSRAGQNSDELRPSRRTVLAAGGAVALSGFAGCATLEELFDDSNEQVVGTTLTSSPAAFYAGRPIPTTSDSSDSTQMSSDETMVYRTGPTEVRHVPATAEADSREIDLEGWSTSGSTKAQDYNSSRSNKPSSEWWVGPDDDIDDDDEGDVLVAIHEVELALLGHVTTAQEAVSQQAQAEAKEALDAFSNATTKQLRPQLDKCGIGVCEIVRENSDDRAQIVRIARVAVDEGDWATAERELADVEEIVLGDIERLDDELVERRPGRPKYSDIIEYLRETPTIGESFTMCLPDAKLPGDRGSLAEELTLDHVLAYFASSYEEGGRHTPFHNKYRPVCCFDYDNDRHCIKLDGPVSLHTDIACGNVLSAKLDTYTTENRAIVGYGTEGGAVVSAASASADTDGKRVFLTREDNTGEIILGEDRDMVMPGNNGSSGDSGGDGSVSPTLVCPVTVTPEDSPTPLPGLFYLKRVRNDEQIIFAGGWILDEGALFEDSASLLFAEGPTEIASVTPADIESDNYDDRIVEQFSRDRSQQGSGVVFSDLDADDDGIPTALRTDKGRKGLNAVNVKVLGEQGDDDGDEGPSHASVTALDAPLVHLTGARELSDEQKLESAESINKRSARTGRSES